MRRIFSVKPKIADVLILGAAIFGIALFFTGHHHGGDEGPGISPVAAHDCSRSSHSEFLHVSRALAHDDDAQFSQPPPPTAPSRNMHEVQVSITDTGFSPKEITARLCDTLIITNMGKHLHQPAVGPHPYHTSYPGLEAKVPLEPGEKFTFLLTRPGQYPLHDHLAEQTQAKITIVE